ncbi:hypothetical protein C5748_03800 [Phyllobacterium phragmitis]|uniref:Uncharacterized protein n=1 Tax=Phyllobacterium phragmitis TaxID=2670329 RepID=A0A2S9IXS6_9HYPH|nr:hypothetical protein [Phyllobacterium phragmitis]PRD45329.1 hypothetical protein C5748_03800 [Phyllobacterium phragmitis]
MKDRIIISPSGIRASKRGFDANNAADINMAMIPGMDPMIPAFSSFANFAGGGSQDFALPQPLTTIPYIVLRGNDNKAANRRSYCAEIWLDNNAYRTVRIRNIDGVARTVTFFVLRTS